MYSPRVIEQAIEKFEARSSLKLTRVHPSRVEAWTAHLSERYARDYDPSNEKWSKPLTKEELAFIKNERLLSMFDFRYWAIRYATISRDGGGICKFNPWESQELFLRLMAKKEEENVDAASRGEPVDGIIIIGHKSRQLGETALGRTLTMHRLTTKSQQRAMAASVDDDKIQEMYDRDKLIFDSLPWYMKPVLRYDEKAQHITFEKLNSRVLYQTATQKGGLGVSRQFDLGHLTECSTWENAYRIELDFLPTLPMSLTTLAIFESTPYGRGNWWHEIVERVRDGGSRRLTLLAIPWYAELSKYRAQPPAGWEPNEVSMLHAQKIADTSTEYMGYRVLLPKENLYWWESTRAEYQKAGKLNFFLTNYWAVIEESFQHSGESAFSPELLEHYRMHAKHGIPYEIIIGEATA